MEYKSFYTFSKRHGWKRSNDLFIWKCVQQTAMGTNAIEVFVFSLKLVLASRQVRNNTQEIFVLLYCIISVRSVVHVSLSPYFEWFLYIFVITHTHTYKHKYMHANNTMGKIFYRLVFQLANPIADKGSVKTILSFYCQRRYARVGTLP